MVGVKTLPETVFVLAPANGEEKPLKLLDDYVTANEQQTESAVIDAPIVFVGYGITAPEYRWDDYKGYDLKGRVALLFVNEPTSDDPNFFKGKALTYYGRWTFQFEETARKLVSMAGLNLDKLFQQAQSRNFKPIELPVNLKAHITSSVRPFNSRN